MAVVELENVTKIYELEFHKVRALDGIDLEIAEGEFITIIGPSGSGKSTLLNIIGCMDLPTSGKVFVDGADVTKCDDKMLTKIRREKIGFVFQRFNLIPTLTAQENIALPTLFGGSLKTRHTPLELLELVNMDAKFANHRPNELSAGQQQRVAIARALVNDPKIVLADEPTGNLDVKTGKGIMDLFRRLNDGGMTILMVTHNLLLTKYSTRTIKIIDGKLGG